jgi:hypothetical protein
MSRLDIFWLVPALFALHNIEEVAGIFNSYPQELFPGRRRIDPTRFLIAVGLLTFLVTTGTTWSILHPELDVSVPLVAGFQALVLVNSIFPHLVMFLKQGSYHPGLVTAGLINIPFSFYFFERVVTSEQMSLKGLLGMLVVAPFLMVLFIQGSLAAAKLIHSAIQDHTRN